MNTSRDSQFPIPSVVNPTGLKRWCITIPDDPDYAALLSGAIVYLTNWWAYDRDTGKNGTVVAANWLKAFNTLGVCPTFPAIEFRTVDNCEVDYSLDGGVTWLFGFSIEPCATATTDGIIDTDIANGKLAGQLQPAGQGGGTPAQCYDYDVQLLGNGAWVLPIAVGTGDQITTGTTSGIWSDGELGILSGWSCADGGNYVAGICTELGYNTRPTDPAPTVDHMRLIALVNGANGVDAWNDTFLVAEGISNAQLTFQANDSPISDNMGVITFHVQICKAGACITYNFVPSNPNGWTAATIPTAPYTRGAISPDGWRSNTDGANTLLRIVKTFSSSATISSIRIKGFAAVSDNNPYQGFYVNTDSVLTQAWHPPVVAEEFDVTVPVSFTGVTSLEIDMGSAGYETTASTIALVELCGTNL